MNWVCLGLLALFASRGVYFLRVCFVVWIFMIAFGVRAYVGLGLRFGGG